MARSAKIFEAFYYKQVKISRKGLKIYCFGKNLLKYGKYGTFLGKYGTKYGKYGNYGKYGTLGQPGLHNRFYFFLELKFFYGGGGKGD